MAKIVQLEGKTYNVPDDATMDEIDALAGGRSDANASIRAAQAAKFPTAAEGGNPDVSWYTGLLNRGNPSSRLTQALEQLPAVLANTAPGATGPPPPLAEALIGSAIPGRAATAGMGLVQGFKSGPVVKPVLSLADRLLPSAERAGVKFEQVMGAAKDVPLNSQLAYDIAADARKLSTLGNPAPPKPISDFLKLQDPSTVMVGSSPVGIQPPPLTFAQGRPLATAAGELSSAETQSLNPTMQRNLGQFYDAMRTSNREAAASVGMGQLYDEAMREYRQAMGLKNMGEIIKKYALKAAIGTGLTGLGYEMYKNR